MNKIFHLLAVIVGLTSTIMFILDYTGILLSVVIAYSSAYAVVNGMEQLVKKQKSNMKEE